MYSYNYNYRGKKNNIGKIGWFCLAICFITPAGRRDVKKKAFIQTTCNTHHDYKKIQPTEPMTI